MVLSDIKLYNICVIHYPNSVILFWWDMLQYHGKIFIDDVILSATQQFSCTSKVKSSIAV